MRKEIDRLAPELAKAYNDSPLPIPDENAGELTEKTNELSALFAELQAISNDHPDAKRLASEAADWSHVKDCLRLFKEKKSDLMKVGAAKLWLVPVSEAFKEIRISGEAKSILQRKVQQFCDEYMPAKLALDKVVLVDVEIRKVVDFRTVTSVVGWHRLLDRPSSCVISIDPKRRI